MVSPGLASESTESGALQAGARRRHQGRAVDGPTEASEIRGSPPCIDGGAETAGKMVLVTFAETKVTRVQGRRPDQNDCRRRRLIICFPYRTYC